MHNFNHYNTLFKIMLPKPEPASPHKKRSSSKNISSDLVSILTKRFSFSSILNQQHYIKHMNAKMLININIFMADACFSGANLNADQIENIIRNVPFFRIVNKKQESQQVKNKEKEKQKEKNGKFVKIQYENSDRIIILTGVKHWVVKEWVESWSKQYGKKNSVVRQIHEKYWNFIEFTTSQHGLAAKKYFRSKKVEKDQAQIQKKSKKQKKEQLNQCYKFLNRRVRIALLNQDFFTIIFDVINQKNSQKFTESLQSPSPLPFKQHIYQSLFPESTLSSSSNPNSNSNINFREQKQQMDDYISSQFMSQSQSQTSQVYDFNSKNNLNRIKEIDVETSNQGTQIQEIGIGSDDFGQGQGEEDKEKEKKNQNYQGVEMVEKKEWIETKEIEKLMDNQESKQQGKEKEKMCFKPDSLNKNVKEIKLKKHKSDHYGKERSMSQNIQISLQSSYISSKNMKIQVSQSLMVKQWTQIKSPKVLQKYKAIQSPIFESSQQFPSLPSLPSPFPSFPSLASSSTIVRLEFLEIKKYFNQFLKNHENNLQFLAERKQIPSYIRKQSQSSLYRGKFYNGIIKMGKKSIQTEREG